MGGKFKDLTGEKYGKLTVISRAENIVVANNLQYACWNCLCDCGGNVIVKTSDLKRGHTQSCGCLQKERVSKVNTKHGGSFDRLYVSVWANMIQRCTNPKNAFYSDYGGRGIKIYGGWYDYANFRQWALENGYDENADYMQSTIDRIDSNGDYSPENCRIADIKTQSRNTRTNINLFVDGCKICLLDLARSLDISYDTARKWYHDRNFRTYEQFKNRAAQIRGGKKPRL